MKFGKILKQEKQYMNAWAEHFMSYSKLKKLISPIAHHDSDDEKGYSHVESEPGSHHAQSWEEAKPTFFEILDKDQKRVEKFYQHLLGLLSTQLAEIQHLIEDVAHLTRREKKKQLQSKNIDAKLKEKYELLTLLAHYCQINREGFRKIVKKWDKNTGEFELVGFMQEIDRLEFADHSALIDKITQCERMYADAFLNGNIDEARAKLQYLKVQVRLASGKRRDGVTTLVGLLVHLFKDSRKKKKEEI